ncbi:ATP-binding protein [Patescibacteria group bacterium]|nr:ATP-binding protein [Patescibacteria group bacterium]
MLIEFSIANFKSFKNKVTFSMVASKGDELKNNYFQIDDSLNLLKTLVIYGANASGKTNLFAAMEFFQSLIIFPNQSTDSIQVDNFKLNLQTSRSPSLFEIIFIYKKIKYIYGFKVDQKSIHEEWLTAYFSNKPSILFKRNKNKIKIGDKFKEGIGLENKTKNTALFLNVVAQFNGQISNDILDWFKTKFYIVNKTENNPFATKLTIDYLERNDADKQKFIDFIKTADLGINDVNIRKIENSNLQFRTNNLYYVLTGHSVYGKDDVPIGNENFNLQLSESTGTIKFFTIAGDIFKAQEEDIVLVIDELDSSLHLDLVKYIVNLFNLNNKRRSQLIFNVQNIELLRENILRRDQIWFTEKDKFGATDLYPLSDYKLRKDASIDKLYKAGRFGAIPNIDYSKTEEILHEKKSRF